jgi:hypothetical protein
VGGDALWLSLYRNDLDAGFNHYYSLSLSLFAFSPGYANQLAITSSSYLVFSFIIAYMAMLATQQRLIHAGYGGWLFSIRLSICPIYGR